MSAINLNKTLKILTLSAFVAAPAVHAETESFLNSVMGTINPKAEIQGPIYRPSTKVEDKYGDEIAKIIIQEAHKKAKRFLDQGNTQAYYAFMALALTVPNQEGLMVHFREVPADRDNCNDSRSTGKDIESSTAKDQFQSTLNDDGSFFNRKEAFLVKCRKLRGQDTYRQLILGGSDGSDVGVMQLSARWHYEDFLKPEKYKSVRSTFNYAFNYISGRFRDIMANRESGIVVRGKREIEYDFRCFNNKTDKEFYEQIIRGSWSAYNGGPTQICRFADEASPFKGHDNGFVTNLKKTMDLNNGGLFGFSKELEIPMTETMRSVVEEVITNLEKGTNERKSISAIL